jgi:glycosyltransferase involved in cell wall biosynthesis
MNWDSYVKRVVIQTANYLNFDGTYSAGGRQRHIRDLANVIRYYWGRDVLIIQKGKFNFKKKCNYGFDVIGIKSTLTAIGDPFFSYKVSKYINCTDGVIYASGEDAWPFFLKNSKAIQHGVWWDGPQSKIKKYFQAYRVIKSMESVRSMLCVDTNFINWLRTYSRKGFYLTKKCQYIPNYVNLSEITISNHNERSILRIICARRYEEKRGIDLFIESLSILKKLNINFEAHISSPDSINIINEKIKNVNLSSFVTVSSDNFEEVLNRYQHFDIAVIPTIWSEGTSLSCIEAICSGLPVVTTPVGGLGNLVLPSFNGLIVNPDPESISNALIKLNNRNLLLEMKQNCLLLRDTFSIQNWNNNIIEWLKK